MDRITTYQVRLQDFIEDKLVCRGFFGPSIDKGSVSLALIGTLIEMLTYSTDELKICNLESLKKGLVTFGVIEDNLRKLSLQITESKAIFSKAIKTKTAEKNKRKQELEEDEDDE